MKKRVRIARCMRSTVRARVYMRRIMKQALQPLKSDIKIGIPVSSYELHSNVLGGSEGGRMFGDGDDG
jgi:hypothetical protein